MHSKSNISLVVEKSAGLVLVFLLGFAALVSGKERVDKPVDLVDRIRHRCLAVLGQAMKNESGFVRGAAARAAGESEDPALIPLLKKAAQDVYPTARLFALQGMRNISTAEARSLAEEMMKDLDVWVQGAAIEMLGDLGDTGSVEQIRFYLDDQDRPVRLAAATALYKLGETRHLGVILETIRGKVTNDRYQAIGYLGKIGTPEVLEFLIPYLRDDEDEIVFYTLKAIGGRAGPDLFPDLKRLAEHENPSIRYQAVLVLGSLPAAQASGSVQAHCADPDGMVRLAAAVSMDRLGSRQCEYLFAELLKDNDFGIRSTTARILGELAIPQRKELLTLALEDSNTRVRTAATRAVGMMGGGDAFPLLMQSLDDPREAIRAYAAGNLIKLMR